MEKRNNESLEQLQRRALEIRIDSVRATSAAGSGHPTSCLSAADLISALFFHAIQFDLHTPDNPDNDRFILSKGHAIPVVYAAYKQLGVISDDELLKLRDFTSPLEGHPTRRFAYNEAATGSLGQGLAIGAGMALHSKKTSRDNTTFVMLGDGETSEGSVWEAAGFSAHYSLDTLIAVVDANRLGQSGESIDDHRIEVMQQKWMAFGWHTQVIDGHDMKAIVEALEGAMAVEGQPAVIIAKTFKGFGLDETQDQNGFHGKPFKPEAVEACLSQLRTRFADAAAVSVPETKAVTPTKPESPGIIEHAVANLASDPHVELFSNGEKLATRKAFGYGLAALGRSRKDVFALDGDVKNSTFTELFEKEHADRFIQCFIAEQTMLGVSTGLERRGALPFAATFGAFFSRAYDQIRMAAVGQNALRLAGSHCGVSIGEDGPSQMGLEDLAMMRALPNSIVLYPSDAVSAYKLVYAMAAYDKGISYMRTTRAATPILYDHDEAFPVGGCKVLKSSDNDRLCLVAAGITLHEALKAHELLKAENISVAVIDLYSIKPLDVETLSTVASRAGDTLVTIEDHYIQGGLGEAVAHAFAAKSTNVHILGVDHISRSGTSQKLLADAGIDAENIASYVRSLVSNA